MISPQAGSKNVLNSWHWAGLQLGFYSWSQSSFYLITKSIFDLIDKLTSSLRKLSSFYWIRLWKWIYNCSFSSEIFFFFFFFLFFDSFLLWENPQLLLAQRQHFQSELCEDRGGKALSFPLVCFDKKYWVSASGFVGPRDIRHTTQQVAAFLAVMVTSARCILLLCGSSNVSWS